MAENNKIPDWKARKAALEKSNFAQTCSLLSQFLREKRAIGVGMPGNKPESKEKPETFRAPAPTVSFLTNMGNQAGSSTQTEYPNFLKQLASNIEDSSNKSDPGKTTTLTSSKPETAQMTIFYAGQVLVFNDLPSDKADEVISLARKGCLNVNGNTSAKEKIDSAKININGCPDRDESNTKPGANNININVSPEESNINTSVSVVPKSDQKNNKREGPAEPDNGSDLPIARRNSLHRFLEKRKDRVAAKAPYQVNHNRPVVAAPSKPADEGEAQEAGECSEQLELKLW
ncbi:LOW QUALITY PROTEIN: Jasmonate-zim domain protein [Parasponia andersonii]|uniref:Protein TIFY n=1 Tax=Parasponia andersonii TaxID=3476 RepID=A0A2P5B485_PARAD|nr:LOW QUALITY PROTEIN: Jasmonate-zim domain protein [Parasponia andersonii]